jgi:Spy/CpxP family protein refolding chaperone
MERQKGGHKYPPHGGTRISRRLVRWLQRVAGYLTVLIRSPALGPRINLARSANGKYGNGKFSHAATKHLRLLSFCPSRTSKGGGVSSNTRRLAMRTLTAVLTLLVALSVGANRYAADEPQSDGKSVGLGERLQDLNLTDEQETRIHEIRKECGPKIEEAARELATAVKEEMEKVQGVLSPQQKEKLQALKEEHKEHRFEGLAHRIAHLKDLDLTEAEITQIRDIRKEYHPRIAKAMEGLKGILTDEQKKAREEALAAGKRRKEVLAALNLTNEQKEKVEGVCKEVHAAVKEELEKIRSVLTEEQEAKLAELKDERRERVRDRLACMAANAKELNLSDEQKTTLTDIRKEFRPKVQEAGNKLRGAVREEVDKILIVIKG